jgi:uncharacterized repeat protein (TIGR02543 family)
MKKEAFVFLRAMVAFGFFGFVNVKTASGQAWTSIESGSINVNTALMCYNPQLQSINNNLYAIWIENGRVRVKRYDGGTTWTIVDGSGKYWNSAACNNVTTAVYNNVLYISWEEADTEVGGISRIHVIKYDGTNFTFVQSNTSGSADDGRHAINLQSTQYAYAPALGVHNGKLYISWIEGTSTTFNYQIHVSEFDGTYWKSVDGGNTESGLNKNYSGLNGSVTPCLSIASYGSNLYVAWREISTTYSQYQFRVKRYDGGSTWTFADGNAEAGLNYNSGKEPTRPSITSFNGYLYAIWSEATLWDASQSLYVNQIRLKKYNGTTWTYADGGTAYGWNKNISDPLNLAPAYNPTAFVYNSQLYVAWDESDIINWNGQIRVVKYDGVSKTFIDGGGDYGINVNNTKYAQMPFLGEKNGELFAAWQENTGTSTPYLFRIKKYPLPPIVTSVSVPANGTYKTGDYLTFTVNFNKNVTVSGGTQYIPVTLNTGGAVNATYQSGSGTASLTFRYTVASGNADPDGIVVGSSIVLPGGCTIRDANALDAGLTLNSVGATTAVLVDGIAPSVSSINRQTPSASQTNANSVVYRVTFSESISGVDVSDFTLTKTGTANGAVASVSASSGTTIDITVNSITGNGTLRLDLNSSSTGITDNAGNGISSGFASGQTYTIDKTAPVVSSISRQNPSDSLTSLTSVSFRVAFSENVINIGTGSFQLTTSGVTGTIASLSAMYGTSVDVTVNSISGDGTLRLDLKSSGTGITDSAGNAISGGFTTGQNYGITTKPVVLTSSATSIGTTTATGNGNLTALGASNPTSYGICWDIASNPDTTKSKVNNGATSSIGTYTAAMTGLTPNTTYHVCAFAGNSYGISYGADLTFTTAPVYTVTYDGNTNTGGAVPVDANTYAQSATVSVLNNTGSLVKTGYSFTGWNTASDGSGSSYAAGGTFPMGTSNIILYAQWTIKKYIITMTATNGSVGYSPSAASYDSNTTVQLTATPGSGYSFTSWSGDVASTSNPVNVTMDANKTITANFTLKTYQLTVGAATGGTISAPTISPQIVSHGVATTITAAPVSGYTFVKWSRSNVNAIITDSSAISTTVTLSDSATVTAVFSLNAYTITISATNGSITKAPEQASYAHGSSVQLTPQPSTGYSFTGWSGDLTGNTNPASITMDGNKIITATFTPVSYSITYNLNGGTNATNPASYDITTSTITLAAPSKTGFVFGGWYATSDFSGSQVTTIAQGSTGNVVLYAKWAIKQYTITLTATNGSVGCNPSATLYDSNATIQLTATPGTGYSFANWSGDLTGNTNPASITMDGNKIITATFTPVSYSITYNLNGGTNATNPASYDITTSTITLAAPSKTGFVFGGWYAASDFSGSLVTAISQGSTGDVILYAKWIIKQYTISLTAVNGSVGCNPSATSYDSNAIVNLIPQPNIGYTFTGWSGDLTGNTNPASISMNGNKTVTATFSPINYSITYNLNGGTNATNPVSYDITTSTITLAAPSKTGFVFGGWYEASDFSGSLVTAISQGSTGDVILYAKWALCSYSLTVSAAVGGTISTPATSPVTVNYGTATSVAASPSAGYSFVKWTRSNANVIISDSTQPATTVSLVDSATILAVFSLNLPSVPLAITPVDGFFASADSILFIWNKSTSEVDKYCLKLAADSAMTTVLSIDSSVADTTFLKKSFVRNKVYYWQVRAHNAAGWSEYCSVHKFTVQGVIPVLPKECTVICNGIHGANGKIRFGLPKALVVTIRLFNAQGKIVRNVYSRQLPAGYHTADLELAAISRGFYILEFTAGEYSVKKSFFNY